MRLSTGEHKIFYALLFPALIETVLSRVFVIADSIMLGQMENSTLAVAAVGLCASPINLIVAVTSNFFIGTTSAVAWYYGAGEKEKMRTVAWQSMGLALVVASLFSLFSVVFAGSIMGFVCGDGETLALAASYYKINAYGFFFHILTMNISAILRGIGVTRLPMLYNLTGGVLNVVLNYLLIYGVWGFPELRSDGAAWATTISKGVSLVFALGVLLFTGTEVGHRLGVGKKLDKSIKTRLLPIGITAACEQLVLQIGALMTAKIIAVLPTTHIAANQIVANMEGFAWATGSACQTASTSLFGRSLGENNVPKAKSYLKLSVCWTVGFAAVEMVAFTLGGNTLAALFSNDVTLYPLISTMLILAALALPFINVHQTVSGALRSAGDSVAPLIASLVSLWVFRVVLGYLTVSVLDLGMYAYRWCIVADQAVRCAIVCGFYLSGHWKKKALRD